jgi:general stress protein 26
MARRATHDGEIDKLWEMIKDIRVAMMVTEDGGALRGRPMWTAGDGFDGELWFFTRRSAHKVDETKSHPRVNLAYADPGEQHYVSISGSAQLVEDKAKLAELWREPMRTWFPDGLDDADLALLRVKVHEAEYWDSPSGVVLYAAGFVKAVVTGEPPRRPGEHEKLKM